MLPVLFEPSLIQNMLCCCPALHIHQISHQRKRQAHDCRVTGVSFGSQSLRLMSCGSVLKFHRVSMNPSGNHTHSCTKAILSSLMVVEAGFQAAIERPKTSHT
ncbi:hypothetical protein TNCV_2474471 [Trichonephila clavipes]|nr:hypothetical protein TNCV_2474471 [Trichonephila clavipes]